MEDILNNGNIDINIGCTPIARINKIILNKGGDTPLMCAVKEGHFDIVKRLLEYPNTELVSITKSLL